MYVQLREVLFVVKHPIMLSSAKSTATSVMCSSSFGPPGISTVHKGDILVYLDLNTFFPHILCSAELCERHGPFIPVHGEGGCRP